MYFKMTLIYEHIEYGQVFTFEPPIDMGEHTMDSIYKIAAVAILGTDASESSIAEGVEQSYEALRPTGGDPVYTARALNEMLAGKHHVEVRRFWQSSSI